MSAALSIRFDFSVSCGQTECGSQSVSSTVILRAKPKKKTIFLFYFSVVIFVVVVVCCAFCELSLPQTEWKRTEICFFFWFSFVQREHERLTFRSSVQTTRLSVRTMKNLLFVLCFVALIFVHLTDGQSAQKARFRERVKKYCRKCCSFYSFFSPSLFSWRKILYSVSITSTKNIFADVKHRVFSFLFIYLEQCFFFLCSYHETGRTSIFALFEIQSLFFLMFIVVLTSLLGYFTHSNCVCSF